MNRAGDPGSVAHVYPHCHCIFSKLGGKIFFFCIVTSVIIFISLTISIIISINAVVIFVLIYILIIIIIFIIIIIVPCKIKTVRFNSKITDLAK